MTLAFFVTRTKSLNFSPRSDFNPDYPSRLKAMWRCLYVKPLDAAFSAIPLEITFTNKFYSITKNKYARDICNRTCNCEHKTTSCFSYDTILLDELSAIN